MYSVQRGATRPVIPNHSDGDETHSFAKCANEWGTRPTQLSNQAELLSLIGRAALAGQPRAAVPARYEHRFSSECRTAPDAAPGLTSL
jgi:hypothetical protein